MAEKSQWVNVSLRGGEVVILGKCGEDQGQMACCCSEQQDVDLYIRDVDTKGEVWNGQSFHLEELVTSENGRQWEILEEMRSWILGLIKY